ncbi:hypothetical protein Ae201684P_021670 [Aphanomyces euteiches]|nr:hypothetical protein Ae201684P_021670 [Aphanomyces euteiches]
MNKVLNKILVVWAFNGEIVNSDAMQMYKGLDIATAKVTQEEMQGVPHHLLSCIDPVDDCTVVEYKTMAMNAIHDILSRGKVPVVVGGTMYYTQSILWKAQLIEDASGSNGEDAPLDIPSDVDEAYQKLVEVDPEMAQRLHSKDVRRVQRSLEVFYQTGTKHSELIAKKEDDSNETLFDACMLWVDCDRPVLHQRLDSRVDKMVEDGLVPEIESLMAHIKDHLAASPIPLGLKRHIPSHRIQGIPAILGSQGRHTTNPDVAKVLEECIVNLKTGTRQYAKRQITWIRNRIVPRNIPVYKLDTTNVNAWTTNASTPALAIASAFLKNEPIPFEACTAETRDTDSKRSRTFASRVGTESLSDSRSGMSTCDPKDTDIT